MNHLIHYKVFENNIEKEDFPKYGSDLTEREMMIIGQKLGKSIVPKIFRKLKVTKDDGYYYVESLVVGIIQKYSYMVYDSFKEFMEYLTFKKYIYNGNIKKVTSLINENQTSIDLTFDSGRLLYFIITSGFSDYSVDDDYVESVKSLCEYKFEVDMIRRCIELLMHYTQSKSIKVKIERIDKITDLVKYMVDHTDEFTHGVLSNFIRISVESQYDFRFIKCFVESKHFNPGSTLQIHGILGKCIWEEDLKSMRLLLENGVRFGLDDALWSLERKRSAEGSNQEILDEMEKLLNKFRSKGEN